MEGVLLAPMTCLLSLGRANNLHTTKTLVLYIFTYLYFKTAVFAFDRKKVPQKLSFSEDRNLGPKLSLSY